MALLEGSTSPLWLTVLVAIATLVVSVGGLIVTFKISKQSRTSQEHQAQASRESAERVARDNREHAAAEARLAREVQQRQQVYSSALVVLEQLQDDLRAAANLGTPWPADLAKRLGERYQALIETGARLRVFGSSTAYGYWGSANSMFGHALRMMASPRAGAAENPLSNLESFINEFTRVVRTDLGTDHDDPKASA